MLRVFRSSVKERINERAKTCAEVLEDKDASLDIAGQECATMPATWSECRDMRSRHPLPYQSRRCERVLRGGIVARRSGRFYYDSPGFAVIVNGNAASDQIAPVRLAEELNLFNLDRSPRCP